MNKRIVPRVSDIKLGRGGTNFKHHGNERLRNIAMQQAAFYCKKSRPEKKIMIDNILKELIQEDPPVRFLRKNKPLGGEYYWEEADNKEARRKVSMDIRDAVKKMKRQERKANESPHYSVESESRGEISLGSDEYIDSGDTSTIINRIITFRNEEKFLCDREHCNAAPSAVINKEVFIGSNFQTYKTPGIHSQHFLSQNDTQSLYRDEDSAALKCTAFDCEQDSTYLAKIEKVPCVRSHICMRSCDKTESTITWTNIANMPDEKRYHLSKSSNLRYPHNDFSLNCTMSGANHCSSISFANSCHGHETPAYHPSIDTYYGNMMPHSPLNPRNENIKFRQNKKSQQQNSESQHTQNEYSTVLECEKTASLPDLHSIENIAIQRSNCSRACNEQGTQIASEVSVLGCSYNGRWKDENAEDLASCSSGMFFESDELASHHEKIEGFKTTENSHVCCFNIDTISHTITPNEHVLEDAVLEVLNEWENEEE